MEEGNSGYLQTVNSQACRAGSVEYDILSYCHIIQSLVKCCFFLFFFYLMFRHMIKHFNFVKIFQRSYFDVNKRPLFGRQNFKTPSF